MKYKKFIERLDCELKRVGVTRNRMLRDLGMNHNSFNNWGIRESIPSGDIIAKIAQYFNVSTDYLLRMAIRTTPNISPEEIQLLNNYRTLNSQDKEHIKRTMAMALRAHKEQDVEVAEDLVAYMENAAKSLSDMHKA